MTARESVTAPLRVLGRYALHEVIASGGMATVHYGRLLGPVGFARTVAIKRLHERLAQDPEFTSMFLDEARLAARIRHPNVVPTLDVVALDGELFLVMEYVQGESLARLFRHERDREVKIPLPILVTIMVGVLHGLHAAHEATAEDGTPLDLVHRDVSPQNILVGVDGVARVLDFGVAKAAGRASTTRDGQLKGKLSYMAPEQLRGNVSRAIDVYAAGVVLWEGLVGRKLYKADSEAELVVQLLENRSEAPSKHATDIPPELDAIVVKALSTDPSARFATAREMARALEKLSLFTPASEIGEWVEKVADEVLSARAQRLSLIEQSSTSDVTAIKGSEHEADPGAPSSRSRASRSPSLGGLPASPSPPVAGAALPRPVGDTTEVSLTEGSTIVLPIDGPRGKRLVMAVGAGALLAVFVVGLLLVLARGQPGAKPVDQAAAPGDPRHEIPPPPASAVVAEPAPPSAPSPAVPAPPTARTSVASRPPLHPSVGTRPTAAPVTTPSPPPAAAAPNCDPPYTIDASGARRYKRECMK